MTNIHVLSGGTSDEREVSLRSGAAVAQALASIGHTVTVLDPSSTGLDDIVACDVVFPVLHGAGGEDGTLQAKLEQRHAKYVGSDEKASKLCWNKWEYRKIITAAGLQMARADIIEHYQYGSHELSQDLHVLKPIEGGSSIDTYIVRDLGKIPRAAILETFERHQTMLLEELIEGTELTVGVLGDKALPIIEIIPPANEEFDYKNKYNGATQEIVAPKHIGPEIQRAAQELALQAHRLTGCRDFSRTDIICNRTGKLFLLETNTIPGMTDQSLFPKMARTAGIDMPDLCSQLVAMALSR